MTKAQETRLYREIGARIRGVRTSRDMTQDALSKKLEISRTSLVNIESGRQHAPLHTLWDIAEALDLEVFDLIPVKQEIAERTHSVLLGSKDKALIQSGVGDDKKAVEKLTEFVAGVRTHVANKKN